MPASLSSPPFTGQHPCQAPPVSVTGQHPCQAPPITSQHPCQTPPVPGQHPCQTPPATLTSQHPCQAPPVTPSSQYPCQTLPVTFTSQHPSNPSCHRPAPLPPVTLTGQHPFQDSLLQASSPVRGQHSCRVRGTKLCEQHDDQTEQANTTVTIWKRLTYQFKQYRFQGADSDFRCH